MTWQVLVADLGYLLVVIMAFMTWGLFGILEIGLLIEVRPMILEDETLHV